MRIVADRPGLCIERQGAQRDPWRSGEPLQSLKGRGAGRAVRALVDTRPPFGVRPVSETTHVSVASLSRTLDLLDREGLVTRGTKGDVSDLDWRGSIRRWVQDYDFVRSNRVSYFLWPREFSTLIPKLRSLSGRYVVTGSVAAERFAPVAPSKQLSIYVDDIAGAADELGLRRADAGANVLLIEPYDEVVFDRPLVRDELRVVAPTQLAADLLTGPGREPPQGEELLDWMGDNVDVWRT